MSAVLIAHSVTCRSKVMGNTMCYNETHGCGIVPHHAHYHRLKAEGPDAGTGINSHFFFAPDRSQITPLRGNFFVQQCSHGYDL